MGKPPPGVARIKSIKCSFTTSKDESVKMRLADFKAEGLDVVVTYQMPVRDELISSPWTGLESLGHCRSRYKFPDRNIVKDIPFLRSCE